MSELNQSSPKVVGCELGGRKDSSISDDEVREALNKFMSSVLELTINDRDDGTDINAAATGADQEPKTATSPSILILPPDFTRFHSQAGKVTRMIHEFLKSKVPDANLTILPALGTHAPMTQSQIETMFGSDLGELNKDSKKSPFVVHDWRNDVVTIGEVPAEMVEKATNGMVKDTPWPAQLNKLVWEQKHDLILSIGQVVPHEVMGMANFNKNLFVGVGGVEAINLSHFIGAVYGMEKMMGKASNPLRDILNCASEKFLQSKLPLWYILTVVGNNEETGDLELKGFYIGSDIQVYLAACELSLQVNFTLLDDPLEKVVVYLDPDEFESTWLGNKAIYRTRMALEDNGELIIIAPGVKNFGEDEQIDQLIRKYGYHGTKKALKDMADNKELADNTSAVAHMIHGSAEGRFKITYCPSSELSRQDIESAGFQYADVEKMQKRYDPSKLKDGWNTVVTDAADGKEENIFYISNPALGLWAAKSRFDSAGSSEADDAIGKENKRKLGGPVTDDQEAEKADETKGHNIDTERQDKAQKTS
jgi:nickel-dependent lactate racemase